MSISGGVHAVGFNVAVLGNTAIRAALDQLAARATGALHEQQKTFGSLYTQLARDYRDESGFDPFRDILRECILDHRPRAAGDVVLGQIVPERRLHSLPTAAEETGIGAELLEYFLIEAGAFKADDKRPQSRKLFDAKVYAEILKEIPTLVGPIAMRTAMGATQQEIAALADEGLLITRTRVKKVKKPWRISDGIALVAELSTGSILVDEEDIDWETLLLACRRRAMSLADLDRAIRIKQLTVGRRKGVEGFHGIVVSKFEVNPMAAPRTKRRQKDMHEEIGTIAAAEFGRSVGLRNSGAFLALIEAGHVSARTVKTSWTGRSQYRLTPKNRAEFHRRFVTLTTLSSETGQHRNTLRSVLASGRVSPFSPDGQDFGSVYLRDDVAGLIKKGSRFAE